MARKSRNLGMSVNSYRYIANFYLLKCPTINKICILYILVINKASAVLVPPSLFAFQYTGTAFAYLMALQLDHVAD